jgi:hypothetical protein
MLGGYSIPAPENAVVEGSTRAETLKAFWEAFDGQLHVPEIELAEYDVMKSRDCRCVSCLKTLYLLASSCTAVSSTSRDEDDVAPYALPSCQYVHNMVGRGGLCVDKSDAGGWNVSTWWAVGKSGTV